MNSAKEIVINIIKILLLLQFSQKIPKDKDNQNKTIFIYLFTLSCYIQSVMAGVSDCYY